MAQSPPELRKPLYIMCVVYYVCICRKYYSISNIIVSLSFANISYMSTYTYDIKPNRSLKILS